MGSDQSEFFSDFWIFFNFTRPLRTESSSGFILYVNGVTISADILCMQLRMSIYNGLFISAYSLEPIINQC